MTAARDFDSGRDEDFDEVDGTFADGVDAIEDETAGGGVDEVDDVVELVAELVNVFAVEGSDEGLIELGEDDMGDFVALVLDGFDDLDLFGDAGVVREHLEEGFGTVVDIARLAGRNRWKKALFARHEALQKSWHVVTLP